MNWLPENNKVPGVSTLAIHATVAFCLFLVGTWQANAAWYETQGQAEIIQGNREQAKERATQEALKQALLFAGASVRSVQTLANGLLKNDKLEISATGEVSDVQLVNEVWHDNYVSVTVRADIFPQPTQCQSVDFVKTIATSFFPIITKTQALDGQIQEISEQLPNQLSQLFQSRSDHVDILAIAPYTAQWYRRPVRLQAPVLGRQYGSQFVLIGEIQDISVERQYPSTLAFWKEESAQRTFQLSLEVIDVANGGSIFRKNYQMSEQWEFDRFSQVDVSSQTFWQSPYGRAVTKQLEQAVVDIDDALACQPATGRVLQVARNELQVSLGRAHGLSVGDELFLYQVQEVIDNFGHQYTQYRLHPVRVKVVDAFVDSATVVASDNSLLANIQPNDFVAKR